jgi:uroporphyrinogen decarboxylase
MHREANRGRINKNRWRAVKANEFGIVPDSDIDRLLKTLRFEKTDRVPNWELGIEARTVEHLIGKKLRSSFLSAEDSVRLALTTGMDAMYTPVARNFGELRGIGEIWRTEEDGSTTYLGGTVKSQDDLDQLDLDGLRQDWLVDADRVIDECLEAVGGTAVGVSGRLDGPFWLSQVSVGLEDSLVALMLDPELITRIMDFYTDFERELARLFVLKGLPLVMIADDLAHTTGPMVNPSWFEEHWFPRMQTILEPFTGTDVATVFHSCGKLDDVIPLLIQLGCDAVQAMQPNCNDIYGIRRQYGTEIALMGNIDITFPLSKGTAEDVRRDVLEHLEGLGREGGYIVCSSHSVLNSVPPENYIAMVKTVQSWS